MQLSSSKAMENSFEENNNTLELLVNISIMKFVRLQKKIIAAKQSCHYQSQRNFTLTEKKN